MSDVTRDGQEWLTPAEVAAVFTVDPKTISRWDLAGRFDKVSVRRILGGHRRFLAADIDALAKLQEARR